MTLKLKNNFAKVFKKMIDFNKNWIKSGQVRENGDHEVLNLAKNRENITMQIC